MYLFQAIISDNLLAMNAECVYLKSKVDFIFVICILDILKTLTVVALFNFSSS